MASPALLLRGACHCGRYQYAIDIPAGSSSMAQVIFDSNQSQRISSASPLSAFIRIPLEWYRSQVFAFFPDETSHSIRRAYSHPYQSHTIRHFCGYCGTPISNWSEQPRSEADFIQLTLGSLLTEDLHGLQDLGLLPEDNDQDTMDVEPITNSQQSLATRITGSIPWFEALLSGSRLGNLHTTKSIQESRDGRIRVELEITEWTAEDEAGSGDNEAGGDSSESSTTGKRKRADGDEVGTEAGAGVSTDI